MLHMSSSSCSLYSWCPSTTLTIQLLSLFLFFSFKDIVDRRPLAAMRKPRCHGPSESSLLSKYWSRHEHEYSKGEKGSSSVEWHLLLGPKECDRQADLCTTSAFSIHPPTPVYTPYGRLSVTEYYCSIRVLLLLGSMTTRIEQHCLQRRLIFSFMVWAVTKIDVHLCNVQQCKYAAMRPNSPIPTSDRSIIPTVGDLRHWRQFCLSVCQWTELPTIPVQYLSNTRNDLLGRN